MMAIVRIEHIDKSLYQWIYSYCGSFGIQQSGKWISKTGDGTAYLILGGYLCLQSDISSQQLLVCLLTAFLIERPTYFLLKNSFKRIRPCDELGASSCIKPSDKFSLPSGHSAAAWLLASVCSVFYPQMVWFFYSWAVLVSMSRVVLGVHYPLDIIAGALLGSACGTLALNITGTV